MNHVWYCKTYSFSFSNKEVKEFGQQSCNVDSQVRGLKHIVEILNDQNAW